MQRWVAPASVFLIVGASLYAFYELAEDVETSTAVARFDEFVTDRVQRLRRPWLDLIMKVATYAGGTIGITVLTFILVFILIDLGKVSEARFSAVLVIGGTILANGLKPMLRRVRPTETATLIGKPSSSSFPSGHSMASMCLALAAIEAVIASPAVLPWIKIAVIVTCMIYVLLVGVSRIYLGVHWPSDVVASWLLGTAWIAGTTGLTLIILQDSV
ncbi:MAG: phosphatase PAP2 family protein [Coriobacteriia bacterium]|nr:phosphatase PAP2 family protein [Coriobacteriia bacterium]